jgi:1,4-dihydroxy-2-naphthoate octaprenyltransferase
MTGPAAAAPTRGRRWVLGARPRTLAAAAVPVLVGTASGWWLTRAATAGTTGPVDGQPIWWRAACALVVALGVQVGTNYANDYSDGVRGTDADRVGPVRLVASGLATPEAVRRAALIAFGVAAVAGLALAAAVTWWLLPIGAACFVAGWLYTGGPRPYGYLGLGELFVFCFFGVVATVGSSFVQYPHLLGGGYDRLLPLWASIPVGLLATALLEANNLRDIAGDTVAGKKTLAVRLGRRRAGWLYAGSLAGVAAGVVAVAVVRPWALLALLGLALAVEPLRTVLGPAEGRALLPVLGGTGRLQLVIGALLTLGILL